MLRHTMRACAAMAACLVFAGTASAHGTGAQIARGRYLVSSIGCTDCHTPGHLLGHPDNAHYLGGSDVGFPIPGQGVFVGPNLTPDSTGLGDWTVAQIATAITTGERPDGRILAPVMPWRNFAHLTKSDARAIALYLKSIPPVAHKVPGPFGPHETPGVLVMTVVPGSDYADKQKPEKTATR